MEKLQVAICDDSLEERQNLFNVLKQSKTPINIYAYDSGENILREFKQNKFDLILIDIYMNGLTGVDTVTEIRKIDENVLIAFITSSTEYTLESYRLNVIRYIEKPVKDKEINDLLMFAVIKKESRPKLIIKKNGRELSIYFENIMFIEQKNHTLNIYIRDDNIITINEKLDNIENQFDNQSFLRCHKSYIVNFAYVKSIDDELMIFRMVNDCNVHIRRESYKKAKKSFEGYLFNKARGQII